MTAADTDTAAATYKVHANASGNNLFIDCHRPFYRRIGKVFVRLIRRCGLTHATRAVANYKVLVCLGPAHAHFPVVAALLLFLHTLGRRAVLFAFPFVTLQTIHCIRIYRNSSLSACNYMVAEPIFCRRNDRCEQLSRVQPKSSKSFKVRRCCDCSKLRWMMHTYRYPSARFNWAPFRSICPGYAIRFCDVPIHRTS